MHLLFIYPSLSSLQRPTSFHPSLSSADERAIPVRGARVSTLDAHPNQTDPQTLTIPARCSHAVSSCSVTTLLEQLAPAACPQCHPLSLRSHDSHIQSKSRLTADPCFPNSIAALPTPTLDMPELYSIPPHTVSTRHSEYPSTPSVRVHSPHTNAFMPSHTGCPFRPSNNTSHRQFHSDAIVLSNSMNLSICQ